MRAEQGRLAHPNYRSKEEDMDPERGEEGQKRNTSGMEAHDGSISSCRQDEDSDSQGSEGAAYSLPHLPEEIWHHIHSLVPMREAATTAGVSHVFLRSWRCHPNLIFTMGTICPEQILRWTWNSNGLGFLYPLWEKTWDSNDERKISEYNSNIDHILANHRGPGVKEFMLQFHGPYTTKSYNRLNGWLQIAITPVLEDLTLSLLSGEAKYEFPCSLLSDSRNTIQYISLRNCVLRPTVNLGLRCLTELELYEVRITGDELGRLISSSFALENLKLEYCCDIVRFEIPCQLQRLSFLEVNECSRLEVIENKAPNMSCFEFTADENEIQLALGQSFKVKNLCLTHSCAINYAIDKLASSVPNLETLTLYSWHEVLVQSKYELIVGDPSTLRQMPGRHHDRLKDVKITGFCPQKSLVELTRHILESATSLKCLILDTIRINYRCSGNQSDKCHTLNEADIKTAPKSVEAIKAYIVGKVPSTVQLDILGPCSRCHAL